MQNILVSLLLFDPPGELLGDGTVLENGNMLWMLAKNMKSHLDYTAEIVDMLCEDGWIVQVGERDLHMIPPPLWEESRVRKYLSDLGVSEEKILIDVFNEE